MKTLSKLYKDVQQAAPQSSFLKYSIPGFYDYLNNHIRYGYIDRFGVIYSQDEVGCADFQKQYRLQIHDALAISKIGHCWDYVELSRYYFTKNRIACDSYFICDPKYNITHTTLLYHQHSNTCCFESLAPVIKGIHVFTDTNHALCFLHEHYEKEYPGIQFYKYPPPNKAYSIKEFISYVTDNANLVSIN